MTAHLLTGTKQEIVESLNRIDGEVREAIVFVKEPAEPAAELREIEHMFDEMLPFMVDVSDVDESREAIYARLDGE